MNNLLACAHAVPGSQSSHYIETLRRTAIESDTDIPAKLARSWCSKCSILFTLANHSIRIVRIRLTKKALLLPPTEVYLNSVVYSCFACNAVTTHPGVTLAQKRKFADTLKISSSAPVKPYIASVKGGKKSALQALLAKQKKPKEAGLNMTDFMARH